MEYNIDDCHLIDIPEIQDDRGTLSFIESNKNIPFEIKNVFYIYDIKRNKTRGNHAHKSLHEFLICISGSCEISLDDGINKKTITLDKPSSGIHLVPYVWTIISPLSNNTICLVLASDYYDDSDYIRNYNEFLDFVKRKN